MATNSRCKRLLFFEADPEARDSSVQTVNRVATMLTRRENKRRLAPNQDPLVGRSHIIDVEVCLLGRRGLCLAVSSPSIERHVVTKSYLLGGTRHEQLPVHLSLDGSLDPIVVINALDAFEAGLRGRQSVVLQKWVPSNLSSTTYVPVGGSLLHFLESLPDSWRSFRWKQRRNGSWYKQRVPFHLSL